MSGVGLPLGAVEEGEAEVDERGGDGAPVELQVFLLQVPAARADGGRGEPLAEASLGGVEQGELAADEVGPGGGGAVLEVRHPHVGPGGQGPFGRAAVGRGDDLDAPVLQSRSGARDPPGRVGADRRGDHGEVQRDPVGEPPGLPPPLPEQRLPASGEGRGQPADEVEGGRGEDLVVTGTGCREDADAVAQSGGGHGVSRELGEYISWARSASWAPGDQLPGSAIRRL